MAGLVRIRRLLTKAKRLANSWGEVDPMAADGRVVFLPPARKCRSLLLCTKLPLDPGVLQRRPTGAAVIVMAGLLDGCPRELIVHAVREWGCELSFLGDLDPRDLLVFLHTAKQLELAGVRMKYRGIDSQWIGLCRKHVQREYRAEFGFAGVLIKMHRSEARFAESMLREVPEISAIVGEDAAKVLKSGHKVEIEGMSNPSLYRKAFSRSLARLLWV